MQPVEFDTKKDEARSGSSNPIGTLEIDFQCYHLSDYCDSSDSDCEGDTFLKKIKELEKDDEIVDHFYEGIKNALGKHITKNENNKYRHYVDKIGKLVSY